MSLLSISYEAHTLGKCQSREKVNFILLRLHLLNIHVCWQVSSGKIKLYICTYSEFLLYTMEHDLQIIIECIPKQV